MKVLVTGASGFVGAPTCRRLLAAGHQVIAAIRRDDAAVPDGVETRKTGELGGEMDWRPALDGIDAIVHLAARAHVMKDSAADPLALFRAVNRDGAIHLAEQAAQAGVRRLVFVSSIKVNGESTPPDRPFRADDRPAPVDPYGISKAEAEAGLAEIAARTGLSLAIVRPPLVHGPDAKGNLASLIKVVQKGWPLPLGAIDNRRSLVGVANLADALAFLVTSPAQGSFLIRDGEDVSTPELLRLIAQALDRPARLLPIPVGLLRLIGRLTGREGAIARLTGSLVVDDSPLRGLGWNPPVSLKTGIRAFATGRYDA